MVCHHLPNLQTHLTLCYPEKQRETENENHDHKEELRSSNEFTTAFQKSEENEPCGKKEDPTASRKLVLVKATRRLVRTLSAILSLNLCSKRLSFLQVKGNGLLLRPTPHQQKGLPAQVSKAITKMIRHHDQDEREQDGSCRWKTVKAVLLEVFAQEGAEEFSDSHWLQLIQQDRSKTRVEYSWITRNPHVIHERFGDTPVVFQ